MRDLLYYTDGFWRVSYDMRHASTFWFMNFVRYHSHWHLRNCHCSGNNILEWSLTFEALSYTFETPSIIFFISPYSAQSLQKVKSYFMSDYLLHLVKWGWHLQPQLPTWPAHRVEQRQARLAHGGLTGLGGAVLPPPSNCTNRKKWRNFISCRFDKVFEYGDLPFSWKFLRVVT